MPRILTPTNLIPIWLPSARSPVLVQQVSSKIFDPLDPVVSDINASGDRAIHTAIVVLY